MAIFSNVDSKLVERVVETEIQCRKNDRYSMRGMLDVAGTPTSIKDNVFQENGLDICDRDIFDHDPAVVGLSERTKIFINKSLCPLF